MGVNVDDVFRQHFISFFCKNTGLLLIISKAFLIKNSAPLNSLVLFAKSVLR